MINLKLIVAMPLLFASCVAGASDKFFEKGGAYKIQYDDGSSFVHSFEVIDIKGKWIFIKGLTICHDFTKHGSKKIECWANPDYFTAVIKVQK